MSNDFHASFAVSNRANKTAADGDGLVESIVGVDLKDHQPHATDGRTVGTDALMA
jgi:hypothetical protein